MNERQNRTVICSVLFLDLVEYSRKPVAEQMKWKERFNALLREALKAVAPNDRIVLDTGDGAAITFLGDPEDALFMALGLRDALLAEPAENGPRLRSGINLGPVKLVKDVNGRPNIIGDGINVAQRIMGFAEPGQVLVSRSYYEVVSRLSDDYSQLFLYEGSRTDKHVREHEVYGITADRPATHRALGASQSRLAALAAGDGPLARMVDFAQALIARLAAHPRAATAVLAAGILALGGVVRANRELPPPPLAEPAVPGRPAAYVLPATAPVAHAEPQAPVSPPSPPAAPVAEERPAAKPEVPKPPAPKKVAAAKKPRAEDPPSDASPLVAVSLAVLPWGEVYVNGRQHGVSPPVRSLHLAPGRHEIELRNTAFPSHVEVIDLKPGDKLTVRHKFQEGQK